MIMQAVNTTIDWDEIEKALHGEGYAVTPPFLSRETCGRICQYYSDPNTRFRTTIKMARYNFGRGEYKYFAYPLPEVVQSLRECFYANLAPIANQWARRLGNEPLWPDELQLLSKRCHDENQRRPTPLMLHYQKGDYNCLHQDLYGPIHFPLQVIVQLTKENDDFSGGELILVEQRPRMQSRPIVLRLEQGSAAIIPVRDRPRRGVRGFHRAAMRHGVGEITAGDRYTLGLIFHDAA